MPEADFTAGLHTERHRDGSIRARGQVVNRQPDGCWEWFRRDGTMLRSSHFDQGRQTRGWTTYDTSGAPYEVTTKD